MAEFIVRGVPKSLLRDGWWLVENPAEFGKMAGNPVEASATRSGANDHSVTEQPS